MEAEDTYQRQRQHLNKAISSMTAEDKQSLMENGWRLWNLFPPIQRCASSEKVSFVITLSATVQAEEDLLLNT